MVSSIIESITELCLEERFGFLRLSYLKLQSFSGFGFGRILCNLGDKER